MSNSLALDVQAARDRRWRRALIVLTACYIVSTIGWITAFVIGVQRFDASRMTETEQTQTIEFLRCQWTFQGAYNVAVADYLGSIQGGKAPPPQAEADRLVAIGHAQQLLHLGSPCRMP